jgi:hypothetical protein
MINKVDFSNFQSYQGKESKSFEVLCYHICVREFGHLGEFTAIEGSGGDGGIEFYLELENGDVWGWQCKYFGGTGRLKDGGRKKQINNSIITAGKKINLKKWILCLKNDLTPDEISWFDTKIKNYSSSIKTSWWGESYLSSFLSRPKFKGISNFFFGNLELSDEWFKKRFEENFTLVKAKYDEDIHIIDELACNKIQKALLTEEFIIEKDEVAKRYEAEISSFEMTVGNFKQKNYLDEGDLNHIEEIIKICNKELPNFKDNSRKVIESWDNKIKLGKYDEANKFDFKNLFKGLNELQDRVLSKKHDVPYNLKDLYTEIDIHFENLDNTFEFYRGNYWNPITQDVHLFANAGDGKTHLSCDIAKKRIDRKLPTIFIPAIKFSKFNSIENAILSILDIPQSYSFDDLIGTLDTISDVKKSRIPIIIDGLNETRNQSYGFSDLWDINLKSFIEKISTTRNVVLITTCRKSYRRKIWSDESYSSNFVQLHGFYDPLEAIRKYFKKFKIRATIRPISVRHFKKPIFLQIFCLAYQSPYKEKVELELTESLIFNTYEEYFKKINHEVERRYDLPIFSKILNKSLKKIGLYLWENDARAIPIANYYTLLNDPYNHDNNKSPSQILLNEDLLFVTEYQGETEIVEFSYQFLAGYTIAKAIIDEYGGDFGRFIIDSNFEGKLFADNYSNGHPLYEDIRECFAILLPTKLDKNLSDFITKKEAFAITIKAISNLPSNKITDERKNLIVEQFQDKDNRKSTFDLLLLTFASPSSKLNMYFWSNLLELLSITERDLSWTEFVREESNNIFTIIASFEKGVTSTEGKLVTYSEQSLALIAEFLMWVLTTTNLALRDTATRALYSYSLAYPSNFSKLVIKSIQINDLYIQERMLGVFYGLSLAERYNSKYNDFYPLILPKVAREIYDLMFTVEAQYSTTHIIVRDYSSRILLLANMNSEHIFNSTEVERFTKPFSTGGIRKWGESEPKESNEWLGPIHMDFNNYQIGYIVPNGNSYSNPPEKQQVRKQIYWRIYYLGYTAEDFSEIDKRISSWQYSRGERPKIERYGKKYSWIAYYEIAGLREDLGLLRDEDIDEEDYVGPRQFTDTIDICFPDEIRSLKLIVNDQLGRGNKILSDWIENGGVAPIEYNKHLVVDNLAGLESQWVCLDGFIDETDNTIFRSRFTFVRGLFVKENEFDDIAARLKNQDMGGRWLPDPSGDYNLYLGEVGIWDEGYIQNSWQELSFKVGTEKKKVYKNDPLYKWLFEERTFDFLNDKMTIKITKSDKKFIEHEEDIYEKREVLLPVIEYNFSSSNTIISSPRCNLPNVEIQRHFNLILKPKTHDFYDKNGKIASMTFEHNSESENFSQRFTFFRKDLFNEFLQAKGLKFMWVLWGERDIGNQMYSQNYTEFTKENDIEPRQVFSEVIEYIN